MAKKKCHRLGTTLGSLCRVSKKNEQFKCWMVQTPHFKNRINQWHHFRLVPHAARMLKHMSSDFLSSPLCTCFGTSGWAHSGVGAAQSCGQGGAERAESIAARGGDRRGFPRCAASSAHTGSRGASSFFSSFSSSPSFSSRLLPCRLAACGWPGTCPGAGRSRAGLWAAGCGGAGSAGGGCGAERCRGLQRPQSHRQPRGAAARGPRLVPVTPNGLCLSAAAAGGAGTGTWLGASSAPSAGSGRAASPGDSSCSSSSSPCSWTTCCWR